LGLPLKHEKSRFSASVSHLHEFPPDNVPKQSSPRGRHSSLFNPNTILFLLLHLDLRQLRSEIACAQVLTCKDFKLIPALLFPHVLRIPEEFSKKVCEIIIWEDARCLYRCPWLSLGNRHTKQ